MTKDQIDELMRENGIVVVGEAVYALCNLVEERSVAAEREACAQIAKTPITGEQDDITMQAKDRIAAAIRARGQG